MWGWLLTSALAYMFHIDQLFIMKTLLVRHASYFIFGAALSLLLNEVSTKKQKYLDYSLLAISGIYSTLISFWALPPYFLPNKYDGVIIAALHPLSFLLVIVFIYLSKHVSSTKTQRALLILGGMTYPLYLVHQTVGKTLIDYFSFGTTTSRGVITMFFILFISFVLYTQDKKIRAFLRKKIVQTKPTHT